MATTYLYPDENDHMVVEYIGDAEPWKGCWETNEKWVLKRMENRMQSLVKAAKPLRLLDAGCGTGRLFLEIEHLCKEIVGIDPDKTRLEAARRNAVDSGIAHKTMLNSIDITDLKFPNNSFDVILCSHVVQHVPTVKVNRIIGKLSCLLQPGGSLFLMAAHSKSAHNRYLRTESLHGEVVNTEIQKDEFNELAHGAQSTVLPAQLFSEHDLVSRIEQAGLRVTETRVYHTLVHMPFLGHLNQYLNWDALVNILPPLKKHLGWDIAIVAQKPLPASKISPHYISSLEVVPTKVSFSRDRSIV